MYAVLANDGRIDGKKFLSEELARGLAGQAATQVARREHGGAHAFSPRLPRIAGSRFTHGFRSRRSGRNARLGRPRDRQLVRFRPQPAVDAAAVRHGIVRGPGRSAAQCHRGRPSPGSAPGAAAGRDIPQTRRRRAAVPAKAASGDG